MSLVPLASQMISVLPPLFLFIAMHAVDGNWHLGCEMERYWPMLVHGPFLWYGREFRCNWIHQSAQYLAQLEDGELVPADNAYARANPVVARYLRRYDDALVEVDTRGHATLGDLLHSIN